MKISMMEDEKTGIKCGLNCDENCFRRQQKWI